MKSSTKVFTSDTYADDDYSDYQLGGIWDDIKSAVGSVAKGVASVVKPVAPQLIYRGVTGEAPPPEKVFIQPAPVIQPPAIPKWVIPVGIGGIALLVLSKLKTIPRRR